MYIHSADDATTNTGNHSRAILTSISRVKKNIMATRVGKSIVTLEKQNNTVSSVGMFDSFI